MRDGLPVDLDELHRLVPDKEQFEVEYMCKFLDSYGIMLDPNLLQFNDVSTWRSA